MRLSILAVIFYFGCYQYSIAESAAPKAQHAQVSVAVMPFFGTDLGTEDELIAVSMRDGVLRRLVNDPKVRVVVRRRAYALSLDAEILVDDPSASKYRTPADYVVFGHLVRAKTGSASGFDLVVGIYEALTGDLKLLQEVSSGSADPELLAESFYLSTKKALHENTVTLSYNDDKANNARPNRIAMLPVWVLGAGDYDFWEIANQLMEKSKSGILAGWPSTNVVDADEVIQLIEAHGLNQIGGRADAYAENVAQVLEADQVLLVYLNNYTNKDSEEVWSLGLMAIDIESGIITRADQRFYSSLDELLAATERAAFDLTQMQHDLPETVQSTSYLRERLNVEGRLYYSLATSNEWDKKWRLDDYSALRVEMAEMAVSTIPEMSDREFLDLLDRAYHLNFRMPKNLDVHRSLHASTIDSFVLNRTADFLHLVLDSRQWKAPEMVFERDCLRVKILIRMNQPEEAFDYLKVIPSYRVEYSYLLAQIRILEGRYADALNLLDKIEMDDVDYYELKAKAAYGVGDKEREYQALKLYAGKRGHLDHIYTSERVVFLMNQFEKPEERIAMIDKYFGGWGKGTDMVQFTLAKARLEIGEESLALSVLRALQKKKQLSARLPDHSRFLQQELDRLLAPYEQGTLKNVTYKDVNLPPENRRFYIQPIGYSDQEALSLAISRASDFSGFEFVLLPSIELPLHKSIYDVERRQFDADALQQWLAGVYQIPEDALHCCFLLDQDIGWKGNWIYSNTQRFGSTAMSDFRWRKYFPRSSSKKISRGLAKTWLTVFQHPIKYYLGRDKIEEITGSADWPNHAGTIQYSKGTSQEVFQAEFNICDATQKLYREVDWDQLRAFRQSELYKYKNRHREKINYLIEAVGPPVLSEK